MNRNQIGHFVSLCGAAGLIAIAVSDGALWKHRADRWRETAADFESASSKWQQASDAFERENTELQRLLRICLELRKRDWIATTNVAPLMPSPPAALEDKPHGPFKPEENP